MLTVAAQSKSSGSGAAIVSVFALFVLVVVLLALRRSRTRAAQRSAVPLVAGTEVVTRSGMLGTVRSADDEEVLVEVAPEVVVTMLRGAVFARAELDERDPRRRRRTLPPSPGAPG